jgi:formate hydrogenlyase subunit 6/NADH:ubiquinone oxidoreductase subunit I
VFWQQDNQHQFSSIFAGGSTMYEPFKDRVRELLATGEIKGFLALKEEDGHIKPHLFVSGEEVDQLSVGDGLKAGDARYPLAKILTRLLHTHTGHRFGMLVRGCDQRALNALAAWNQLTLEQIVPIGVACPEELAQACHCIRPYPDEWLLGEQAQACDPRPLEWEEKSRSQRLHDWVAEFKKCIKCYGCRNICPMCFCEECGLESEDVVARGEIPPEFPMFHVVRALHMIGRCVDCGMCEEACPAGIPLRTLYKKVNDVIETRFEFKTGIEQTEPSPLHKIAEPPPTV